MEEARMPADGYIVALNSTFRVWTGTIVALYSSTSLGTYPSLRQYPIPFTKSPLRVSMALRV
ncbi:hypothetical protein [Hyperthermus butylicus]|uniref:hypothetical protein n=1 Tax=Hyperthermus butylicus TaxID=54248 RepID=UPI000323031B|nr:hypothetical protein [Hyperthermus butylicus]